MKTTLGTYFRKNVSLSQIFRMKWVFIWPNRATFPQKNLGSRLIMPLWTRGKTGASRDKPGTCRDKTGTGKDKTGTSSTFSCFVHVCPYFVLSLFSPHLDYLVPVCPSFVLPSSLSLSSYSSLKASMHTSKLIFVFFFLQSIIQRIRFAQNLTVVNLFYKEC